METWKCHFAFRLLGPSWGPLGVVLGDPGRRWGRLCTVLGRIGILLGASGAAVERGLGPRRPTLVGEEEGYAGFGPLGALLDRLDGYLAALGDELGASEKRAQPPAPRCTVGGLAPLGASLQNQRPRWGHPHNIGLRGEAKLPFQKCFRRVRGI